jgi:hypothetical protein
MDRKMNFSAENTIYIMAAAIFNAFIFICMMQGIKGYVESHCLRANHPRKRS